MRLRPSGQKGPVATQLSSFVHYQASEAWTWEHMALTRARVVSGPPALRAAVETAIRDVLLKRRDRAKTAADVRDMRARIEKEKGTRDPWELKQVRGGLVDLEFIAQHLQLVHAADHPTVLSQNTMAALQNLGSARLLPAAAAEALLPASRLLNNLTQVLQALPGRPLRAGQGPRRPQDPAGAGRRGPGFPAAGGRSGGPGGRGGGPFRRPGGLRPQPTETRRSRRSQGIWIRRISRPIPPAGAARAMSKKVVLIAAGLLLAAGSVAAISAPHFRGGGHMRGGFDGPMFGERGDLFGGSPVRLGERLKEIDANKDGVITLEEFLAPRDPTFARFDKNNDGVIERAEFEAFAKESADYWVKRFIKRFDADHDGRISKEEFAKARRERFAMRDLDGDGRIGLDDMAPGPRERVRDGASDREGSPGRQGGEPGSGQG